jgi:hypothetical protein
LEAARALEARALKSSKKKKGKSPASDGWIENVRLGSKADIEICIINVCFAL